jgi:hypothetical protein
VQEIDTAAVFPNTVAVPATPEVAVPELAIEQAPPEPPVPIVYVIDEIFCTLMVA